jgi:hypothetical protein
MSAFLLTAWLLGFSQARPCTPQFAPLTSGTHVGDSKIPIWPKALQLDEGPAGAAAWSGTGWVGWKHWGTTLHPVRITVRDHPKLYEGDIEEVAVEHTPDVDYAVRCIPAVRPGTLTIARRRYDNNEVTSEDLAPNRPLGISLGTRKYEMRVESKTDTLENAKVVLSDGTRMQVLFSVNDHPDEPHLEVDWAGDVDRDGKLDLIVTFSSKYSMLPHTLLLSSKARPGQLVGVAATFVTGD